MTTEVTGGPEGTFTDADWRWHDTLRRRVEAEDGLVNQRLTWLLLIQPSLWVFVVALLFPHAIAPPGMVPVRMFLIALTAMFGCALCLLTWWGCTAAFDEIEHLREQYDLRTTENARRRLPKLTGGGGRHFRGKLLPLFIVVGLASAWLVILVFDGLLASSGGALLHIAH
jgi:hypothetical protein